MVEPAKITHALCVGWRWALAAMFLYAGFAKLADPRQFVIDLNHYRMLPPLGAYLLGLYVPWLEIIGAAALLTRTWRSAGWLLAAGLGLGFTVFVGSAWWRGLDISCGCFGHGLPAQVTGWAALGKLVLFFAILLGFYFDAIRGRAPAS